MALVTVEAQVQSPAQRSGLKDPALLQLWHGLHLCLDSISGLETSTCWGATIEKGTAFSPSCLFPECSFFTTSYSWAMFSFLSGGVLAGFFLFCQHNSCSFQVMLSVCVFRGFACLFVCLSFLEPNPWHMEVHRIGVESEVKLPAYARATATGDPTERGQGSNPQPHGS